MSIPVEIPHRHKHADLIHAWADGAEIEALYFQGWQQVSSPLWLETGVYRIKPKEKVKKWRWIYASPQGFGKLEITGEHYSCKEYAQARLAPYFTVIEPVEWTEIEVEN